MQLLNNRNIASVNIDIFSTIQRQPMSNIWTINIVRYPVCQYVFVIPINKYPFYHHQEHLMIIDDFWISKHTLYNDQTQILRFNFFTWE